MAIDSTLEVRRAIITLAAANVALTELVPAANIHPQTTPANPTWPFIRCGAPSVLPRRASCVDGALIDMAMHGFAKPREDGGQVVETAEDHAGRIGAAIARAIDGKRVPLDNGYLAFTWRGSQLLQDPEEADAFHTVQQFRVRAVTA